MDPGPARPSARPPAAHGEPAGLDLPLRVGTLDAGQPGPGAAGALIIVALGASVASVAIATAGQGLTAQAIAAAVLGLAVAAALWWVHFGDVDDGRAERAMSAAPREARPRLALAAYFHAAFRWVLRTGPAWPRLVTAGFADSPSARVGEDRARDRTLHAARDGQGLE